MYSLSLDLSSAASSSDEVDEDHAATFEEGGSGARATPGDSSSWWKYPDGCVVSAQALMCHGGGGALDPLLGTSSTTSSWEQVAMDEEEQDHNDENDEDDEDEDDDDTADDGSSSMLSNASVRRACLSSGPNGASVGGEEDRPHPAAHNPGRGAALESTTASCSSESPRSVASLYHHPAAAITASLRGGAISTPSLFQSSIARNLLVTALVTLVFEGAIGHILEFLKIVKQTAVTDVSYLQVINDITASKGVAGLWDGFCPWGIVQAVFKGAVFGMAYSTSLGFLQPLADKGLIPLTLALTLAGGIGGGLQGYVLSPTLLLKTRVMTNPIFRQPMSGLRTTWLSVQIGSDIVATEGLATLMKGSNVFALKRVFDWASRYLFADAVETAFQKIKGPGDPLTVTEKSAASLLGGVLSTCVTLPLDVLVAKTQDAKKAGVKVSAWTLFRDELRERGWSGLQKAYMQGFEARLLHVCLTTLGTLRYEFTLNVLQNQCIG